MNEGLALARAASGFIGCRFRLHGRDPATGLDCVGLLGAALAALGRAVPLPSGYTLRPGPVADLAQLATTYGFIPATGADQAGDVWLTRPGPAQLHIAILDPPTTGMIEAHAGLGRVVITPLPLCTPRLSRWRIVAAGGGSK